MTDKELFQALYYPCGDVRASSGLLEACVYFDRVHVLEPNFFRPPADRSGAAVPSTADMAPLVQAGIIEPIGSTLLGFSAGLSAPLLDEDNPKLVRASIEEDLADRELVKLTANEGPRSWLVPTGQQLYWNGLGLLLQRPASRISVLTERVDYYRSLFRSVSYHADIRPPDEARWRGTEELQVAVPYLEAESLLITVTLLACAELGLSPVTDSRLHHEFMRRKLARTYENPELREAIRPVLPSVREQDIGLHTLKLHVPRIAVADVGTVLKIRRKCADSLDASASTSASSATR